MEFVAQSGPVLIHMVLTCLRLVEVKRVRIDEIHLFEVYVFDP